jgi:hypothetical protein
MAMTLKRTMFSDVIPCNVEQVDDVPEEFIASISRVQEEAKKESRKKQAALLVTCFKLVSFFAYSFKPLVHFYQMTWHYFAEVRTIHTLQKVKLTLCLTN